MIESCNKNQDFGDDHEGKKHRYHSVPSILTNHQRQKFYSHTYTSKGNISLD